MLGQEGVLSSVQLEGGLVVLLCTCWAMNAPVSTLGSSVAERSKQPVQPITGLVSGLFSARLHPKGFFQVLGDRGIQAQGGAQMVKIGTFLRGIHLYG